MTHSEPVIEFRPAPVDVQVYRLEPPKTLISHNGEITTIHAAYREPVTNEEVSIGKVITTPTSRWYSYETSYSRNGSNFPASLVQGIVGDGVISERVAPTVSHDKQGVLQYMDEVSIKKTREDLQKNAAYIVLSHLGIEAEDLKPATKKGLFRRGR